MSMNQMKMSSALVSPTFVPELYYIPSLSLFFSPSSLPLLPSALIGDLMQQLDLFISVKPKKGQLQSVIIKSIEQNIQCMYCARTSLLECSYQPVTALLPASSVASPRATPPPSQPSMPVLKETPSRVTFSEDTMLIKEEAGI